ncbi:GH36 C-terminal domain-containing protein, partial [Enterococcus cecorum]
VLTKTKLYGLDTNRNYRDVETNKVYGGDELMELGFYDPIIRNDYAATMYHFKAE